MGGKFISNQYAAAGTDVYTQMVKIGKKKKFVPFYQLQYY